MTHYRALPVFFPQIADARTYRYYSPQTGGLDFVGMCEDLEQVRARTRERDTTLLPATP